MRSPFESKESTINAPFIHCFPADQIDLSEIRKQCDAWGFGYFAINLSEISSVPALMVQFAEKMNFPAYFGRNWDALVDSATDFSWDKRSGYVVVVEHPEHLIELGAQVIKNLLAVCNLVVRRWQSGEDEEGDPVSPTPFHWVFSSTRDFCSTLADYD